MGGVRRSSKAVHPLLFQLFRAYDIVEASYEKDGRLTGTFALSTSPQKRLDITFDPKFGDMPVRAIMWMDIGKEIAAETSRVSSEADGIDDSVRKILERIDTIWEKVEITEGEQHWLPICVRSVAQVSSGAILIEEVKFLEWHNGKEDAIKFPSVHDPDWRSNIEEFTEIDWLASWQEFEVHGRDALALSKSFD